MLLSVISAVIDTQYLSCPFRIVLMLKFHIVGPLALSLDPLLLKVDDNSKKQQFPSSHVKPHFIVIK